MKSTTGEKWFLAVNALLLIIVGLSCLLPLLHIVSVSLSDPHAVLSGAVTLWPQGWTLESYGLLLRGSKIVSAFENSVELTVVGVALSMIFTTMAAYPLSRRYFYMRRFWTLAIVFTMLFSGGLIPGYLLLKQLGLINTYGAIWLPGLVSTFNMLIMRTYFEGIPDELDDAARMDGCGEWRYLLRIVLPLSVPVIATLSIFYAVGYWNSFFQVLMYINQTSKFNLTVLVQQMIQSQSLMQEMNASDMQAFITPEGIKTAGIVVMVLPLLLVYPFMQKYFIKGVMIGAVKG
ncbi:carbohydrate ABC transporter permease [Paenibacillus oleatilyticus]|uniref:carbohydrate ABC transporter permease n=1 Tax=Paenibacillus oleatilyticus TaxID=2594886 RepID=UPI001C1F9571|nr:carbohydrate ABC transporter permease [Paenibacillus oleatilyticus]MBU7315129.1 carbohydrate ABC transporter permease [Paenibacillus oleatilyticus]